MAMDLANADDASQNIFGAVRDSQVPAYFSLV